MKDLIKKVSESIKSNIDKIEALYDSHINELKLISDYDIIQTLGITLTEYESIKSSSQDISVDEEDLKNIMNILTVIGSKINMITIINDKVIRGGGKVGKDAINYIMRKDNEKQNQTAIINVYVDEFGEPLKLNKILEEKGK